MNAVQSKIVRLPLAAITLDDELQPRVKMDKPTWQEYGMALANGAALPPVLVVAEPGKLWLADGYHRLFAHQAAGVPEIEAEVRRGTREDALRLSLAANAAHGKQRTKSDFKRGYDIAVRNGLVEPDDSVGVMELLRCSIRTAEDLTKEARTAAVAKRNAEIVASIDRGETVRAAAERLGVSIGTVASIQQAEAARREAERVQNAHSAETEHEPEAKEPPLLALTAAMEAAGLSVEVPAPERNAVRRRPDGDADAEYTVRDDPRQLHIPTVSPAHPYDKRAMQFCSDVCALIEKVNDADWPNPTSAMDAWMEGRGAGPDPDEVQAAADWMVEFAALYRRFEPQRQAAAQAMVDRAKEIMNGAPGDNWIASRPAAG